MAISDPVRRFNGDSASSGGKKGTIHLIIHGDVHGTGYRNFLLRRATRLKLKGWVRNRSDGTVEVLVSNSPNADSFLHACHSGPSGARVDRVETLPDSDEHVGQTFRKRPTYVVVDKVQSEQYKRLGIDQLSYYFRPLHHSQLLSHYSESSVDVAKRYWRQKFSADIDPALHIAYENLTGSADPRIVPLVQWRQIWKFLNSDGRLNGTYSDKSLYPLLLATARQPRIYVKRVSGRYFDGENQPLDRGEILSVLRDKCDRAIIKPSRTNEGKLIECLSLEGGEHPIVGGSERSVNWVEETYGRNFLVQELVQQHPHMALVNADSVNTLRMVTLRLGKNIHHLVTVARFGTGNRVNDNFATGGICVGVRSNGSFMSRGFNKDAETLARHPTSGVEFDSIEPVPNYRGYVEFVTGLHAGVCHADLISWDVAVGTDGKPLLIELNFAGPVWMYQLAGRQPVFGDLTSDVLDYVMGRH